MGKAILAAIVTLIVGYLGMVVAGSKVKISIGSKKNSPIVSSIFN